MPAAGSCVHVIRATANTCAHTRCWSRRDANAITMPTWLDLGLNPAASHVPTSSPCVFGMRPQAPPLRDMALMALKDPAIGWLNSAVV